MKIFQRVMLPLVMVAMLVVPAVQAQTPKPVVAVSIAGFDELMSDVDFLAKAAGAEADVNVLKFMAAAYTVGLDKSKPSGLIVSTDGDNFAPLGFVPVKDLKKVFASLKEFEVEPQDAGDGVWELTDPAPLFVKEKGGYAFIADKSKYLKQLPDDPVKLLGGLNKEYDIAIRGFVGNVPADRKEWATRMLKSQYEDALRQRFGDAAEDDPEYQLAKSLSGNQIQRMIDLINDTDQVTIGWTTDGMAKKTYLDFSMTAKADTATAKRMALLKDNKTSHAGFQLQDAAVTLALTARMDKDDIDQLNTLIATVKDRANEEIDKDSDLPNDEAKKKAKEVVGGLIDVFTKTIEGGKLDGGAALLLEPKAMTFVTGGLVEDSSQLEASLRKLVDLAKDEPDFPGVKFDAEKHRGVSFHTMSFPVPADEEEARQVVGEKLDVVLGIGEKSAYLSLGKDAASTLKTVLDKSATSMPQDAPPMQLNVALTPIFKFAGSIQDNPILELLSGTLEKVEGKDHVRLSGTALENGVRYRLEVEEGVLKVIGQAVRFGSGGL